MCGISCIVELDRSTVVCPEDNVPSHYRDGRSSDHTNRDGPGDYPRDIRKSMDESLEKIKHRGPDSRGIWISPDERVGIVVLNRRRNRTQSLTLRVVLGHVRLAINDLSPSGAQPFHSSDNKIHAVVNGELYNEELQTELTVKGYSFRGHCDCEIVTAAYQEYGLNFLNLLRGEFSLCIWDEDKRLFLAARDRYGIKPLFYTFSQRRGRKRLLVAAEAKAFLPLDWRPQWDVESLVKGGWNFDERTVFRGVKKVRPGHYFIIENFEDLKERCYWDIDFSNKRNIDTREQEEFIEGVRDRLLDAVRVRLKADVPVGIYLSGGIDSSAIAGMVVHLVKERGERLGNAKEAENVSCFTIAFDKSSGVDESDIAARTAEHLGVRLFKKHMSEEELAKRFEDATYHCEHQNFDLNYVGKFALSELPPEYGFKVVLTGEGSDENFAGYPLYLPDYLREPDQACPAARPPEAVRIAAFSRETAEMAASYKRIGASITATPTAAQRMLNNISTPSAMAAFQPTIFAPWALTAFGDSRGAAQETIAASLDGRVRHLMRTAWHPLHSALYVWTKGHLANQFLTCLGDRGEMAHGLEARTPFLDHRLTEYVAGIPPSWKIRYEPADADSQGGGRFVEKYILREAARPFVTEELYRRTKQAYTAPTRYPPHGPLHALFARLLTRANVEALGFVAWEGGAGVQGLLARVFERAVPDPAAWRQVLVVAQWVVLSRRFGIPRAEAAGDSFGGGHDDDTAEGWT